MASCDKCYYLNISKNWKDHVEKEHFHFEDWCFKSIKPWKSVFSNINPQDLFYKVLNTPRCELGKFGWSYCHRFVYTIEFESDVGVYPYQGGTCTTNKIQIVCDCVDCPGCGIRGPTAIRTIYPWDEYYERLGRRKRPYAPRGRKRIGERDDRRKRTVPAKRKPKQ